MAKPLKDLSIISYRTCSIKTEGNLFYQSSTGCPHVNLLLRNETNPTNAGMNTVIGMELWIWGGMRRSSCRLISSNQMLKAHPTVKLKRPYSQEKQKNATKTKTKLQVRKRKISL
jgi:hypothetical protein